jgi:hypothetical protein
MAFSEVLQLQLPDEFPLVEFEAFVGAVRTVTDSKSEARREFGGASNLIGWRFRACVQYRELYLGSWRQRGAAVGFEELFARERDFFGMFVCGVSTIESIVYACYAVASDPNVLGLAFDERIRRSRSGPRHLKEALDGKPRAQELLGVLDVMLLSPEWRIWTSYRNTMTHRSNIHRIIYAALGSPLPPARIMQFAGSWSHDPMDGDERAFLALAEWLARTCRDLLNAGEQFASPG